jgi:protein TonB
MRRPRPRRGSRAPRRDRTDRPTTRPQRRRPPRHPRRAGPAGRGGPTPAPGVASPAAPGDVAAVGDEGEGLALLRIYGARVRDRLARAQRYPVGATAAGTARVELWIGRDGALLSARITQSAGAPALDRATLAAAHAAAPFPAAPQALEGARFAFVAPVSFRRP